MPISVQEVVNRCNFELDAEGSDRYLYDRDFMPAINSSIEWVVDVINSTLGEKKFSEEIFSELTRVRVWQTSLYSRFNFSEALTGDKMWSILAIYLEPTLTPNATPPTPSASSVYRPDLRFINSSYSASRKTAEQLSRLRTNSFADGNNFITCDGLRSYAYLNPTDYSSGVFEIEILPELVGQFIAMRYVKVPSNVVLSSVTPIANQVIEFPASMTNLIVQKCLNFISQKQNNQSTLYQVTDRELKTLIGIKT